MSCIKNGDSYVHMLPPPVLPPAKNIQNLDSLSNSLTREHKIRFVGLVIWKLFAHGKFQL